MIVWPQTFFFFLRKAKEKEVLCYRNAMSTLIEGYSAGFNSCTKIQSENQKSIFYTIKIEKSSLLVEGTVHEKLKTISIFLETFLNNLIHNLSLALKFNEHLIFFSDLIDTRQKHKIVKNIVT